MGTPQQGGFDIQNFFKTSPSSAPQAATSYSNHPNLPGFHSPSSTFPQSSFPSAPGSYSFTSQAGPPGIYPYMQHYPQEQHLPRPASYPSPPPFIQPPFSHSPASSVQVTSTSSSSPPLDGARLMALLTTQSTGDLRESSGSPLISHPSSLELPPPAISPEQQQQQQLQQPIDSSEPAPAISPALPTAPPVSLAMPNSSSSKTPRGRHLNAERVVYDIDTRVPEEAQPQLEVSPITVYSSDPVLVVGRQISVNRSYICYGLRAGTIRILNINTASRNLLRGHTQRVTDMAFSSDDVHVLASASAEGKVFVREITEGPGEDGKNQITENVVVALHLTGDWESVQPRLSWWKYRPDTLVIGIGRYVLTVDVNKFKLLASRGSFSVEDPIKCPVTNPVDGVRVLGLHDQEVTGLSPYPGMARFASSSKDGTVRIWGDSQLAVLAPHAGQAVNSVAFLSAPLRDRDHVVLLTAGPLSRELKLWYPYTSDGTGWKCMQSLELKSSSEGRPEDAFFNQLMVVPQASFIMLANAKRNSIYVVHVEFGSSPATTQMDYIAEFSVKMPILSFTATCDNTDGDGVMQIYCVQTQAIQQYSLDIALCKPDRDAFISSSTPAPYSTATSVTVPAAKTPLKTAIEKVDVASVTTSFDSVTVTVSSKQIQSPAKDVPHKEAATDAEERDKLSLLEEERTTLKRTKQVPMMAEIRIDTPFPRSSRNGTSIPESTEVVTESVELSHVDSDETITEQRDKASLVDEERTTLKRTIAESTEILLDNLDDSNVEGDGETATNSVEEVPQMDDAELTDDRDRTVAAPLDEISEQLKEVSSKSVDYSTTILPTVSKGRKNKNKTSAAQAPAAASSSASLPEAEAGAPVPSDGLAAQVQAMQDAVNQLMNMQKDLHKQISTIVTAPITKEAKRMETTLGQRLEKIVKANVDAMAAKVQEENAKREKADRERAQQLMSSHTAMATLLKDLSPTMERVFKKEIAAIGPMVAKLLVPSMEKAISDAITKGFSDKTLSQLDKTASAKLESAVSRQLQTQFQTSGRQALQDGMRACFEGLVVPSFERSCRAMFEQVDAAFQKGMIEHTSHAQQQASASHTALATTLQDTVSSVASLALTMKTDLADGQRKLLALVAESASKYPTKSTSGMPEKVLSLQHVEESLDPTIELSRLVAQGKLEDAFVKSLSLSDVSVVSWLCNQVEPSTVFSTSPPRLSQGVLLSLVQQLGCDLAKDTSRKLMWIKDAALALNPNDPMLAPHMRPFLDQLYQNLHRQVPLTAPGGELSELRLVLHVVNSLLTTCK